VPTTGELPTEFSSLVQLTSTSLHDNGLYGNLSVLESMPALEYAYLHRNTFTGARAGSGVPGCSCKLVGSILPPPPPNLSLLPTMQVPCLT
jgi:hypothetical protein